MPVINGVYLKDFTALPSSVTDANIIPIAITGDQVAYKTTVGGIVTDARITSKLLTGLSVTGATILATDTILQAFGKVQNQINGKQGTITLTTTGTSGAATFIANTLNIPNYADGGVLSLSAIGATPNANAATITGTVLNLEPASASFGGVVTTGTQTIAGDKTLTGALVGTTGSFASSGGSDSFAINHSSGAGIALNITKGGNGEGIYVNKTSGSGNAVTIIGTINATTIVKSGGTSSQFLKADGTVDSTAYGTGSVTSVAALTLGTSGTDLSSTVANGTTTPVITLNVPDASASARGVVTIGTQTFAGAKTFSVDLKVNGLNIGKGGGSIATNTSIGVDALTSNITGLANTAIGKSALNANTDGNFNTAVGSSSLQYNTTGISNSALGYVSLSANISGGQNSAFGNTSLTANTTGGSNTAIGYSALTDNISGSNNVGVGYGSGGTLTTGSNNTFIGANVVSGSSSLANNILIGNGTGAVKAQHDGTNWTLTGGVTITGVLTLNSTITNGTYTYTLPSATGTLALTSALSGYLPLSGGTLTGALSGTSATFSTSSNYLNLAATSTTGYSAYMYSTSTVAGYIGNGSSLLSGASNSDFIIRSEGALKFLTNGTNLRLTITLGGNVGIGTESPTQLLQVGGNSGDIAIGDGLTSNGTSRLIFTSSNSVTNWQISNNDSIAGAFEIMPSTVAGGKTFTTPAFSIASTGAATFAGSVSKASGSFRIPHPLPSLSETHQLVHSFIEGPQADLLYRGKLTLVNGKAQANIDTVSTMTEGTFEVLCREVQCFTTNSSGWDLVKGKVIGNIIYIESQNQNSTDEISWMVIGERKDKHMMDTDWTDENGKVIVEPLKPIEPEPMEEIEPIIPTDNNLE
jgi:hypothetical protein